MTYNIFKLQSGRGLYHNLEGTKTEHDKHCFN